MTALLDGLTRLKRRLLRQRFRADFVLQLPPNARLLDVGCGSESARVAKTLRPDIRYVGLDIVDHNETVQPVRFADAYITTTSADFANAILDQGPDFDAVISAHNIEHCEQPLEVLAAMCRSLRPGGQLYMAFPSEASVGFPNRAGCLNFFDDPSHAWVPDYQAITDGILRNGLAIDFAARQYKPPYKYIRGLLNEPRSRRLKRSLNGTWAFWGFETVIWARRPSAS